MKPEEFPMGATVTYADATATTSTGKEGVVQGTVNGPPMIDEETGDVTHVPVFTKRDNRREPTTIWVPPVNILGVEEA